jgi:PAS domain S-box-containing protein
VQGRSTPFPAFEPRHAVQALLLALAYFAAAKLSLLLAIPPGYATPVWPPSGIALACVLLLGNRVWPGIWLGAAAANLTVEMSPLAALVIATGNTLEALGGAFLVRRAIGVPRRFERAEHVVKFVAAGALAATLAASVALLPLALGHDLSTAEIVSNWWTWWQGDASGIIIVAPLILAWSAPDGTRWTLTKALEGAAFVVALLVAGGVLFGHPESYPLFPLRFLVLPFVIWAAFRFGQREVTLAITAVCALVIWNTLDMLGETVSLNESLLVLLAFNSTAVVTGLVVSAVLGERGRIVNELREKHDELETKVRERTEELSTSNRALREDIRERVRTERLLLESEERLRTLFDSIRDYAIVLLDSEGKVASWNQGALAIHGYVAGEIIGRSFACFYTREDIAREEPRLALEAAAREGRRESEGWRVRKDGSRFWANAIITPLRDEAGRVRGYSKVTRDLSERKSAELQTEDARAEAERANRAKSEFLAKMSHELRTPLNSLLILARLLVDNVTGNLTAKQVTYAQTIHDAGMDLLTLINDILDLAKIESGTVPTPAMAPLGFSEIRTGFENTFRQIAVLKGLQFDIVVDERLPAAIETDARRLLQILKNLLSNAFKFTRAGGVSLTMAPVKNGWGRGNTQLDRANVVVAFAVADTGIGIPPDKQALVFEPFQQADGTASRQYGGTGLGLSISRELSKLLGGELRLSSTPGQGSTFTLYLPLDQQVEPQASNVASNGQTA